MKYINKGFTLVELMVVVAIIAIIASVAIPSYSQYIMNAQYASAVAAINNTRQLQAMYFSQNIQFAENWDELGMDGQQFSQDGGYLIEFEQDGDDTLITATPIKRVDNGGGNISIVVVSNQELVVRHDECGKFTYNMTTGEKSVILPRTGKAPDPSEQEWVKNNCWRS
jgi:prepilin-type N-terminal cleavage/methylation domain-containing protein